MKEGATQAPYGIDIPPTPADEPVYSTQFKGDLFADDKSGEQGAASFQDILASAGISFWNAFLVRFYPPSEEGSAGLCLVTML